MLSQQQQQLQYPNLATTTTSYAQFLGHHRKLSVNFLSQTVHGAQACCL